MNREADYETTVIDREPNPFDAYEMLRNANVAVTLQGSKPTYVDGIIAGIGIPTISLTLDPSLPRQQWPPVEYQPRLVTEEGNALVTLKREFDLYEEDFLDLPDQDAVDRYAALLIDLQGTYTDLTRDYVQEVVMGDKYVASGQMGAVGPNAHVHHVSFQQMWTSFDAEGRGDLGTLGAELETLRQHLRGEAQSREHDAEVAEIGAAATAAEEGDGAKALGHLSKVGNWAFGAATAIGTALAAAAIRTATGM
ncbi:MAG: hypothetical protein ACREQ5_12485 [Candidatus Dormibacteria bacterium]